MKYGITKEQSKMLQGLAILMMLYHHLFSDSQALGINYYSLLILGDLNVELIVAYFFKICVGIYAFVTGYGIYRSVEDKIIKEDYSNLFTFLSKEYKYVFRKLFSFYKQYWLVFIIFVPIGFIFYDKNFRIDEFILSFVGASAIYNGAWWYVAQYVKMLLIFPLMDAFLEGPRKYKSKKGWFSFFIFALICIIAVSVYNIDFVISFIDFFKPAYLSCFIAGYIISKYKIIEKIYAVIGERLLFFVGVIIFVISITCRICLAKDASWAKLDFIIVPLFVFGFLNIINRLPKISRFFAFWGGYNTYIWLVHVFLYDHYAKKIVMLSHFSTTIYLTLLFFSLIVAYLLTLLYKYIDKVVNIKKL